MSEQKEQQDRTLDRNLRSIGAALSLPATPGAEQRARWKQPPAAGEALRFRQRSIRLLTTLGSGLAAAVVLCAFYFVPTSSSQVVASTIFRSLRESAHRGLRIQLEDVRIDDLSVSSTVEVLFPKPVTIMELLELRNVPSPEHVFADIELHAGAGQRQIAGLDLQMAASFHAQDAWGFVRVDRLPTNLAQQTPLLAGAATLLRDGLLIDLAGLDRLLAAPDDAVAPPSRLSRWGRYVLAENAGAPVDGLVRGLLTGSLSAEQLPLIVAELERSAEAQVQSRGAGEWLLTASRFRFANPQSEDARMLARAVLRIRYREGAGVQSVELAHVGDADGNILLRFIASADSGLADRTRFVRAGARSLSLDAALGLFFSPRQ